MGIVFKQVEKMTKLAKKVGEESPNTISAFLYYEPKTPEAITKKIKEVKSDD